MKNNIFWLVLLGPLLVLAGPSDSDLKDAMKRCVRRVTAETAGQQSSSQIQASCKSEVKHNEYIVDHEDNYIRKCHFSSSAGQNVLSTCNQQCNVTATTSGGKIDYKSGINKSNARCSDNCRNAAWDSIPTTNRKDIEHQCNAQVTRAKNYFSDN